MVSNGNLRHYTEVFAVEVSGTLGTRDAAKVSPILDSARIEASAYAVFTGDGIVHRWGVSVNASVAATFGGGSGPVVTVAGDVVAVYPCADLGLPIAAELSLSIDGVKGVSPHAAASARALITCSPGPGDDVLSFEADASARRCKLTSV